MILFVDNAPGHPKDVDVVNIKVIFLPANTTSKLQPLDQGIIQNFKQHYRKRLLRSIIAQADKGSGQTVSVLDAVQWIAASVKDVKRETVSACFKRSGFPVTFDVDDEEDNIPLSQLIAAAAHRLQIEDVMTAEEFANADENAPAMEKLDPDWEAKLVQDFLTVENRGDPDDDQPDECDDSDTESECTITTTTAALQHVTQLKLFFANTGLTQNYEAALKMESDLEEVSAIYM